MNSILNNIIYFIFLLITTILLTKYSFLAKLFSVLIPLYILFVSSYTKYKSLFTYIKGLSVFIPLFLYTNYNLLPKWFNVSIFSYILAINLAEYAFMVEFNSKDILSKINAFCLLVLTMYTPIIILKKNIIGFDNNLFWVICNFFILSKGYLFNCFTACHNLVYPSVYSNIIATIIPLLLGSSMYWFQFRAYSLALIFFLDISFPKLHIMISKKLKNKYPLSTKKYYNYNLIYTVINIILALMLIHRGYKNTVLGELIKYSS